MSCSVSEVEPNHIVIDSLLDGYDKRFCGVKDVGNETTVGCLVVYRNIQCCLQLELELTTFSREKPAR